MIDLKVRAWDRTEGRMIDCVELRDRAHIHGSGRNTVILDFFPHDDVAVMLCTGLKDNQDVDIFQSDIVEAKLYKSTKRFIVDWHTIANHSTFGAGTQNLRVIGNIYENPELLRDGDA